MPDIPTSETDLIAAIKNSLNHLIETIREYQQTDTAQRQKETETELKAVVRLQPEVTAYYESEQRNRPITDRRENIRTRLEFVGVGAAIGLAILTLCTLRTLNGQLSEIRRQTNANIASFQEDERAWIGFKFAEGTMTLTIGKPFLVPTQLINTGKTPAKNVHGNIVVGVFKKGESLDFAYTPGHAHYFVQAGTIFPNGTITESFEGIRHGVEKAEPIVITPSLRDQLFKSESFLVVHGRIDYVDIFGVGHWTTYCRYVLHPEQISDQCSRYNDADSNKPN